MNSTINGMLVTREEYLMACKEYEKEINALKDENAALMFKLNSRQQETDCIVIPCKPYCIGCDLIDLEREDLPFPDNAINHRCKHASFCHYQWQRWNGEQFKEPPEDGGEILPEDNFVVISEP